MDPTLDLISGARPNLMKLAPVWRGLRDELDAGIRIVHTGQHYDDALARALFAELGLPAPDVDLEVGSGSHGAQTALILERYERLLLESAPRAVVVFGDVNSTLAAALAATKLGIPVIHVEAGLRSFDRTMPEEINRVLTDRVSDLLLVTEAAGVANLLGEGITGEKVRLVGNTMIDTLVQHLPDAKARGTCTSYGLVPGGYALLTLHRPSNVDEAATLGRLVDTVVRLSECVPFVFPVHPRTRQALREGDLEARLERASGVHLSDPAPYVDVLSLLADARVVLTDSGGIQVEAAYLGVPCLTLRETTEHPSTIECGANECVGNDPKMIVDAVENVISGKQTKITPIPLWDGKAGKRAAQSILETL